MLDTSHIRNIQYIYIVEYKNHEKESQNHRTNEEKQSYIFESEKFYCWFCSHIIIIPLVNSKTTTYDGCVVIQTTVSPTYVYHPSFAFARINIFIFCYKNWTSTWARVCVCVLDSQWVFNKHQNSEHFLLFIDSKDYNLLLYLILVEETLWLGGFFLYSLYCLSRL